MLYIRSENKCSQSPLAALLHLQAKSNTKKDRQNCWKELCNLHYLLSIFIISEIAWKQFLSAALLQFCVQINCWKELWKLLYLEAGLHFWTEKIVKSKLNFSALHALSLKLFKTVLLEAVLRFYGCCKKGVCTLNFLHALHSLSNASEQFSLEAWLLLESTLQSKCLRILRASILNFWTPSRELVLCSVPIAFLG